MKKRIFRLGPATTLAMAGAIAVAYVRFPQWQREAAESYQVESARALIAKRDREKPPSARTVGTLWQRREALSLSPPQLQALQTLRVEEAKRTEPLQRNAERAARDFETWLKAHQNGVTLGDIQAKSAVYSVSSTDLSHEREKFWNRALLLLNPQQRARIEAITKVQS